jgi:sigma-B regulation protein RsbU (phosphoserine phosphatase)
MIGHLNTGHGWQEEVMRAAFLNETVHQERDDDKCLVWISLKKGTDRE